MPEAKHATVLVVYTHEEVTPDFLAMRIAQNARGALHPGEAVAAANSENVYIIGKKSVLEQIEDEIGPIFDRAPTDSGEEY